MGNNLVLGQYYNSKSWFHDLDPRTKLLSILLLMVSVFLMSNFYFLLGTFALIIILILSTRIPFGKFLRSLRAVAMLLLFTIIFQIVFSRQGEKLWEGEFKLDGLIIMIGIILFIIFSLTKKIFPKFRSIQLLLIIAFVFVMQYFKIFNFNFNFFLTDDFISYPIKIYNEGLSLAGTVILRILSLVFVSSLLTLTTKPSDLTNGIESLLKPLKKIGINVSIFAMMISIALRFIPTLINEANKILKAQASRGVDFKESKFREKITQIISLLIPMFVIAYKRAGDLAEAMEARGYVPNSERTSINELRLKLSDYTVISVMILFLSGVITILATGLYAI